MKAVRSVARRNFIFLLELFVVYNIIVGYTVICISSSIDDGDNCSAIEL